MTTPSVKHTMLKRGWALSGADAGKVGRSLATLGQVGWPLQFNRAAHQSQWTERPNTKHTHTLTHTHIHTHTHTHTHTRLIKVRQKQGEGHGEIKVFRNELYGNSSSTVNSCAKSLH